MERQDRTPAGVAKYTKNIISTNSMGTNTKNELLRELLNGISLDDLRMLVDFKKKIHSKPTVQSMPIPALRTKSVKQLAQMYEDNIIQPPLEYRDKPIPTPRKNVKDMVQHYEDNIILPPLEYRDKPIPLPRTKKPTVQSKPIPALRTIIKETDRAMKGYTSSYKINIKHSTDPLLQLQNTRIALGHHISKILSAMKGLKFIETLKVTFSKPQDDGLIYKTAFFKSKAQTIINDITIQELLQLSKQKILNFIAQWMSEASSWTVKSVDGHYLNIVKYEPLKGSSYIELPHELQNSSKGLINMKNDDNECFRWCHIRHLNQQDKYPQRIKKSDRKYIEKLDYSGIEFPVTTKQYNKIEKQNEININVFGYEDKQPYPIHVSKEKYDDHMELLLITKDENKHYVLVKDFNKFMFNQSKHKNKKHFCMHCLQCFSSERVLNNHKDILLTS